ncbi:MAG: NADP-dependent oxidoreductase [Myxococcales bacterium]|nr:NADP-dependent oxidoreductase [Myxococcales bacterium]
MSAAQENRQWKLRVRPTGMVSRDNFEFVTASVPTPADGEALVAVEYASLDPAMRGWLNDAKSYVPPVAIGEVMRAIGVGRVVASKDRALAAGDYVTGLTGVQSFAVASATAWTKIDPSLVPLPRWLGIVGMPGMTAYFGLFDVGAAKAGETLVVSAAAGAVGAVVGQLGKIHGMRVVGIAGGGDKCRYLVDELGFAAAVDYKSEDVRAKLREHAPDGIDVYFDNVGGDILDIALGQLRRRARVVICGAVSQYNNAGGFVGPKNYMSLLVNRARMEGFVVFDFAARYAEAAMKIAGWHNAGKLKAREDIAEGIEQFPEALGKLFRGENFGKLVLKI